MIQQFLEAHEKLRHREHQLVGVEQLVADVDLARCASWNNITYRREIPYVFALLDEVGAGKTKQVVDASQLLYLKGKVDTMLVLTPGFARSTWADADPSLGEVAKHAWDSVPNVVHEYHGGYTELDLSAQALHWVVTNYEFIRRDPRRDDLIKQLKNRNVWFVLDESWAVKGNSDQMKACRMLRRRRAQRVTILNGTPLSDGKPEDLYYQFGMLDPGIIGCKNHTHFKAKHCVMVEGKGGRQVLDHYQNLEELNARIAPYVLSRRTRDCFDLPPMLPPVTLEARMGNDRWKTYVEMRDDMVAYCDGKASVSTVAMTRGLRLAQLTSGFLGGLQDIDPTATPGSTEPTTAPIPAWLRKTTGLPFEDPTISSQAQAAPSQGPAGPGQQGTVVPQGPVCRELGREKLDALIFWLSTLGAQPNKLLVWCRFTPELERATRELRGIYPTVLNLRGGQSPEDRRDTKAALAPGSTGRACVVGNPKAGGASLNFSAANIAVYLSNGVALIERTQSIGRIERPGATQPMLIVDVVATGPRGQKTIDHTILKALRGKEDMAQWTVQQWRDAI